MFRKHHKPFSNLALTFIISIITSLQNAQAAFIDFDDLPPPERDPFLCYVEFLGCMHELEDEYAHLGVIFTSDVDWLIRKELSDGTFTNALQGFNYLGMEFIGELPNFISLNIDSPTKAESSYIELYGEDGNLFSTFVTNGWRGTEDLSTPYIPNEFVSIQSPERIKGIAIISFFGLRTGPVIDNFTFEYRQVGEPSVLLLMLMGIAGLVVQRSRKRH